VKHSNSLGVSAAIIALAMAAPLAAQTLEVEIQGVRSSKGAVQADIYAPPRRHIAKQLIPAKAGGMKVRFTDLPPGDYAVLLYHDENGNGRLDTGPLRLPTEGYAFSQDARARLGPPSFDKMRVTVPAGSEVTTTARMRY